MFKNKQGCHKVIHKNPNSKLTFKTALIVASLNSMGPSKVCNEVNKIKRPS